MTKPASDLENQELEALADDTISDEDYCFVIGPNGELKSVFLPDGFILEPPKEVKKILKMFGIKDVNEIGSNLGDNGYLH